MTKNPIRTIIPKKTAHYLLTNAVGATDAPCRRKGTPMSVQWDGFAAGKTHVAATMMRRVKPRHVFLIWQFAIMRKACKVLDGFRSGL